MLRSLILLPFLTITLLIAQDEFTPRGTFTPSFFAELLDVEVYSSNVIYVVGVGGFVFIDVSDVGNPIYLGRYNPGSIYKRFYNGHAEGSRAIGAARLDGLYILDISNLTSPSLWKQYQYNDFSYESVDFQNGYAYAAVHEAGIEVIQIQNPADPQHVHTIPARDNVWDVFITNNFLYVADGGAGLQIYSLSQPQAPQLLGQLPLTGSAREVIVEDQRAFVALGAGGFDVVDVSDPSNPQWLANFNAGFGITNHLAYANHTIFSATWELVHAIDVSDPQNPILLASEDTPTRSMGIAAFNENVYVADWATVETFTFQDQVQADIHIKPTRYDFGFQGLMLPHQKIFDVYNLGEATLNVTNVLTPSNEFTVTPNSFQVPPGGKESVLVSLVPTTQTVYNHNLTFKSDDYDESNKNVRVFAGQPTLSPGDPAPPFTLIDLEGNTHSLSQYAGKIVLLAFFASW
ncbi:MAG: hypothetical protein Kow0042_22230 [Calditrichia bacterium]